MRIRWNAKLKNIYVYIIAKKREGIYWRLVQILINCKKHSEYFIVGRTKARCRLVTFFPVSVAKRFNPNYMQILTATARERLIIGCFVWWQTLRAFPLREIVQHAYKYLILRSITFFFAQSVAEKLRHCNRNNESGAYYYLLMATL